MKKKVFVGLSGGVDSSVSAALLQKAGYDVTAVFVRIVLEGYPCTASEDRLDALRAATHLDIPFVEIDLSEAYKKAVFEPALREFARGHTPNPDALCNREIKFGLLYDFVRREGAQCLATGHYARVRTENNMSQLLVSHDHSKDQSYFLWAVPSRHLAHTLFPVGHMQKSEVRALAEIFGLPNAQRKDSQGLCFLGPVSLEDMLKKELGSVSGQVLDLGGRVVGTHEGAILYTIGQRHGFTLHTHSPDMHPHIVVAKDIEHNTITVQEKIQKEHVASSAQKTDVVTARLVETNWFPGASLGPAHARFRYRQTLFEAEIISFDMRGQSAEVRFSPHDQVPIGQSLVLYRGDLCLGGGIIDALY